MAILITGGAGYIGSHTAVSLLEDNEVIIFDNLSNSSYDTLRGISDITNKTCSFIEGDIRNQKLLDKVFSENRIDKVLHFAGLKSVNMSTINPLSYFDNNITGTLTLLKAMNKAGIKKFIFSSSATVYGSEASVPYSEHMGRGKQTSPYGTSKAIVESVLDDLSNCDPEWQITVLRYFNPIGAHESALIGENPNGFPNNLLPYISMVASNQLEKLKVFGGDYDTRDGTCRRDYIHVMDIAEGHVAALRNLTNGVQYFNLGTGRAYSVLEIIDRFEKVNSVKVPFQMVEKRNGDLPEFWADVDKANNVLNWKAKRSLDDMLQSAWDWEKK